MVEPKKNQLMEVVTGKRLKLFGHKGGGVACTTLFGDN